jgi:cyclohexa-1,5-dienecarbonyl-CoA hydratase
MTEAKKTVEVSVAGGVRTLTLDRPPVNVMDIGMIDELTAAIAEAGKDPTTRVIVFRAKGKAFCAGVEVGDHTPEKAPMMITAFTRMFQTMIDVAVPTIAVVEGATLGGGAELVLFCDMVLMGPKGSFGVPEITLGFFPPVAAAALPRRIPRAVAMELMLTGDRIDAARAQAIGLANLVLPAEGTEDAIQAFVARVAKGSGAVLRLGVRAVDQTDGMPLPLALNHAGAIFLADLMRTADVREGLASFAEKRKPVWQDR